MRKSNNKKYLEKLGWLLCLSFIVKAGGLTLAHGSPQPLKIHKPQSLLKIKVDENTHLLATSADHENLLLEALSVPLPHGEDLDEGVESLFGQGKTNYDEPLTQITKIMGKTKTTLSTDQRLSMSGRLFWTIYSSKLGVVGFLGITNAFDEQNNLQPSSVKIYAHEEDKNQRYTAASLQPTVYLTIFISKKNRRSGFGKKSINALLKALKSKETTNAKQFFMDIMESNKGSMLLAEKLNFTQTYTIQNLHHQKSNIACWEK